MRRESEAFLKENKQWDGYLEAKSNIKFKSFYF